jgi:hypothetical protein
MGLRGDRATGRVAPAGDAVGQWLGEALLDALARLAPSAYAET